MITPFNRLPRIVTKPGDYRTRDGRRVTIHEVAPDPDPTVTRFAAKGAIWKVFRGKERPRGLKGWHVCGRGDAFAEKGSDIVGPWEGTE